MSFLQVNDIKLHYQSLGSGEVTVVFLHGMIMDNLSSWFFTMANPVSQNCRVLLYDLRGHGFSDRPKTNYGIMDHVEDLKNLLQVLDIQTPLVLVGNSFGGLLALNFAIKYPGRVRGLILVDGQVNDQPWKDNMIQSLTLQGDERDQLIGLNFQNWLGRNSLRKSNRLALNAHDLIYKTSLIADLNESELMQDEDLASLTIPTLAIYGGDSDIISVGHRLENQLSHCTLKVFQGCTHSVLWEKTEEVKALLLNQVALFAKQNASVEVEPSGPVGIL